ncbi:MAG: putative addiction module antidote protein [Proteobacteria bacterium]|nr:putative addiction module antidote protein [Pseudomonadota bacterium]MBU4295057.1 putative addiction module antidote protein [Pseudomonadota bacterium]MCG2746591.1 putative addiction module antidote protein [Desulfobulbaceae bacterium]
MKKTRISELPEFDMAKQLRSEADIAAYVTMVIEDGDDAELAHALGVAARARGMSEVALAAGITREALYKALRPGAHPRFDTINRVCAALGVRLVAEPVPPSPHHP